MEPLFFISFVVALAFATIFGLFIGGLTRKPCWVAGAVTAAGFVVAFVATTVPELLKFFKVTPFGYSYFDYDGCREWLKAVGLIGSFWLPGPMMMLFGIAYGVARKGRWIADK